MRKKLKFRLLSILIIFSLLSSSPGPVVSWVLAEDSLEEIAREAEEERREKERRAAEEAAEAEQERLKAERKAEREREAAEREAQFEAIELEEEKLEEEWQQFAERNWVTKDESARSQTSAFNSETGQGNFNEAQAKTEETTTTEGKNNGTAVEQKIETLANTGGNTISSSDPLSSQAAEEVEDSEEPLPTCSANHQVQAESDDQLAGQDSGNAQTQGDEGEENFIVDDSGSELLAENSSTGEGVTTEATSEDNDEVKVSTENCADVSIKEEVKATSGGNVAANNDGGVEGETGEAQAEGKVENVANTNRVGKGGGGDGSGAENRQTGDDSFNEASSSQNSQVEADNHNRVNSEVNLTVEATSGENKVKDNDGYGQLTTGDVELIALLMNILNMNIVGEDFVHLIVNIFGQVFSDVDLEEIVEEKLGMNGREFMAIVNNSNTGRNSGNEATVQDHDRFKVENENEANVRNEIKVKGVSGGNEVSGNDDRAELMTGRVKLFVAVLNFINTNFVGRDFFFAMINIFGGLNGDVVLPKAEDYLASSAANSQTGASSSNEASFSETSVISVDNQNSAQVKNDVKTTGDSGTNLAYANEDRVAQETGNVNAVNRVLNWVNLNLSGNNWVMLIVNVMGRWLGHIIGFPGETQEIDAPEDGMMVLTASGWGGQLAATNSNTGEGSTNEASYDSNVEVDVINKNNAVVENNIEASAVSGQNKTDKNESVSLYTGWVDISAHLLNIINMNVVGKNFMLVILNIFGSFTGDLVYGEKPDLVSPVPEDLLLENNEGGLGSQEGGGSLAGSESRESPAEGRGGQESGGSKEPAPDVLVLNNEETGEKLILRDEAARQVYEWFSDQGGGLNSLGKNEVLDASVEDLNGMGDQPTNFLQTAGIRSDGESGNDDLGWYLALLVGYLLVFFFRPIWGLTKLS